MTSAHPPTDHGTTFDEFLARYPAFRTTTHLDDLRASEFARLDEHRQVYLDYTGAGLYATSQIDAHGALLSESIFGNPHSHHRPSVAATERAESGRRRVLRYFNASPDVYTVVFTGNASQALKLVGEAYPFESGGQLLLTFDNHNSVNGIREFDRARGARTRYIPVLPPDLVVDSGTVSRRLADRSPEHSNLFAFPAQSNFSGVQHPLEWITEAHDLGWDVLLDAAAFVPTNPLDLDRWRPDYVVLSFYKMFGYPTGIGALIATKEGLAKLHRPWFSGGTIAVASVQGDAHVMNAGAEAFEDGTIDYLGIPAVEIGLDFLDGIGVDAIHTRVTCLTGWLLDALLSMRHGNGRRLVRLYGPITTERRGGTVAFNLYRSNGTIIAHDEVEKLARREGISLRTGCFCNPGAGEVALGLSERDLTRCFQGADGRMDRDDLIRCVNAEAGGAVRASLGLASNFADVHRFIGFVQGFCSP